MGGWRGGGGVWDTSARGAEAVHRGTAWKISERNKASCRHSSLLPHTHNQAATSPAIPLFPLPSVSVFFLFPSSSERGQLENILCSFLAQTRDSQGPLIKDKPSSSLSASFRLSLFLPLCSVTSLHPPYISLSLSLFSHRPFLSPATLSPSFQWRLPLSQLSPEPGVSRPLGPFVMEEV